MKRVKDLFYRRIFLNRQRYQMGAYFLGYVREDYGSTISANMTIADCSRNVTLEFYAGNKKDAANSLYKARALTKACADFTEAYAKACEEKWGLK